MRTILENQNFGRDAVNKWKSSWYLQHSSLEFAADENFLPFCDKDFKPEGMEIKLLHTTALYLLENFVSYQCNGSCPLNLACLGAFRVNLKLWICATFNIEHGSFLLSFALHTLLQCKGSIDWSIGQPCLKKKCSSLAKINPSRWYWVALSVALFVELQNA